MSPRDPTIWITILSLGTGVPGVAPLGNEGIGRRTCEEAALACLSRVGTTIEDSVLSISLMLMLRRPSSDCTVSRYRYKIHYGRYLVPATCACVPSPAWCKSISPCFPLYTGGGIFSMGLPIDWVFGRSSGWSISSGFESIVMEVKPWNFVSRIHKIWYGIGAYR